jgi:glyoxalase-like protein
MYSIDHVVLAVSDLDEAGERLNRDHGLASVPGGVHPGWGTANRIVPLGDAYVELIAVVDLLVGRTTVLGRALLELTADGVDRWFAVCLADTQLEATAARLGLKVEPGTRTRPDGAELRWRGAGLDDDPREAWMPFFIAWDVPAELHPGRTPIRHDTEVTGIGSIEIAGDASRLRDWLGPDGDALPLTIVDGDPGVRAVELSAGGGRTLKL